MIIDAHVHIGRNESRDVTAADAAHYAEQVGLDLVLISDRDAADLRAGGRGLHEVDANLVALEGCRQSDRLRALYWVRPAAFDSHPTALAGALQSEPLAGLVLSPEANGFAADAECVEPYFKLAARFSVPVAVETAGTDFAGPARIYAIARRYPTVAVILYDGLRAPQCHESIDATRHAVEREDARLYVDTAGADVEVVLQAVRAAGADRVLFGSGALAGGEDAVPRVRGLLEALARRLPTGSHEQVLGANAEQLFRLRGVVAPAY